jgi:arylsulfatase
MERYQKKQKPNILFIMTDQMRADALGCMGKGPANTPNLDNLAKTGTLFSNCTTVCPICAPARAALLSGLYPHQMDLWNNNPHTFPSEARNFVKDLKDNGYRTSVFGKTHYYPYNGSVPDMREAEPLIHSYGYDDVDEIPGPRVSGHLLSHMTARWQELGIWDDVRKDLASRYTGNEAIARPSVLPLELYPDVYVGTTAGAYLREYAYDQPFFCFVSFGGPHDPWDCPREFAEQFDQTSMPEPLPLFTDCNTQRPTGVWDSNNHTPPFSDEDVQAIRRDYAGKVSLIDSQIGNLIAILEEKNMLDNTIIVFTSDHGEMNGDYGRLYKYNFFESSLKVPLIIRIPNQAPFVSDAIVELIDLGPTIMELSGNNLKHEQCGKSQASVMLRKNMQNVRDFAISEYEHEYMITNGTWKMVINERQQPYLLFNLKDDPLEQFNLAGCQEYVATELELLGMIRDFIKQTSAISYTMVTV